MERGRETKKCCRPNVLHTQQCVGSADMFVDFQGAPVHPNSGDIQFCFPSIGGFCLFVCFFLVQIDVDNEVLHCLAPKSVNLSSRVSVWIVCN